MFASPPELRSLFEAALNEFENRAGTNLFQHQLFNKLVACESIESVLDILQEQTQALRTSRGDDSTLMKWIKRTVHILHSLSANHTVVNGVSVVFPPTRAVFVAIAILLSAIKDVDKSYDTLANIFESFESFLRRLDIYSKITPTTAITEVIVKILAELLSTISLAIQQVKQGRLKKLGKKLLGESDREVEAILGRLDRLTLEEARGTGTQTLEIVYDLLKNMKMVMDDKSILMDNIHRILVHMHRVASNMNKSTRDGIQKDVRRWLSPPDPSINHNIARKTHHEGSAEWFIHGNTFPQWKMGAGSLLLVHGKPGSGKTILSSSIIEDLKKSRKAGLASIVFFYFDFKDESKNNARGALSSLLVQLAAQSDPYSEILSALYSEHDDGTTQPSDAALELSLTRMLAVPDQAPIYLVIDALDECPNSTGTPSPRESVVRLVKWLLELCCSHLWVSVTTRPEPDIMAVLQPLTSRTISLHNEWGQRKDIANYIKWFVNSDPKACKWRDQDKERVIKKLSERADGMFRWVFCQLDSLRRCLIPRVLHALDELPETLDETYERTLLDIDEKHWVYAHRLFQCLMVALRPLRVEELAEFLAFEFKDGESPIFQADCRHEDPRDAVLSTCSSLITVVGGYRSAIVQFSHFSVKEYLTSMRIAKGRVPRYYAPLEPAHLLVTRACLSILLQQEDQITKERIEDSPLVEYAAQYWVEHAKLGNALSQTEDMVERLFDPSNPHFTPWISICKMYPVPPSWNKYLRQTPLYYAALCNLCGVAEWLVNERSQNINASGGPYGTPLHAASASGSFEVAQFLLTGHVDDNRVTVPRPNRCANINAISDHRETALLVAIQYGPMETLMEITSLLLGHGANPNATGQVEWPIYAALSRGRRDVARLLHTVTHGADPHSRDNCGKTLLHAAAEKGDLKVAEGLLELRADINSRDDQGRTPLHAASQSGNLEFTRQLLKFGVGVNINSRDNQGRTPLHVIESQSLDVALLLLGHGADPGIQDNHGSRALHATLKSIDQYSARLARYHEEMGMRTNHRYPSIQGWKR